MRAIGFSRTGDHYEHPSSSFFVEFPPGPLGIGTDTNLRPITFRIGRTGVRTLSATDSCRDRLAAYFHWNDLQSLSTAVEIARKRKVDMGAIRKWSAREGAEERFGRFKAMLEKRGSSPRNRSGE